MEWQEILIWCAGGATGWGALGSIFRRVINRTQAKLIIGWEASSVGALEDRLEEKEEEIRSLKHELSCLREEVQTLRLDKESGQLCLGELAERLKLLEETKRHD